MSMTIVLIMWCLVLVLAFIVEVATQQLVSIWFAAGAACSLVVVAFGGGLLFQAAVFIIVSLILLILARPILRKLHDFPVSATNNERNLGKIAVIVQTVDPQQQTGRARLDDVDWIAESTNGTVLPVGTNVRVTAVNGARLLVEPVAQQVSADAH